MCIIVAKPKGIEMPSKETLQNCWDRNEDGAGYMIVEGDRVKIRKGFMSFQSFMDSINSISDKKSRAVVMHFRISTGGGIRPETTHPYPIKQNKKYLSALKFYSSMGMCHNGTINIKYNKKEENDTMRMIYKILANDFIKNNLETFAIKELIESYIGNSKLVFLKPNEEILIYNESKGEWNEGIWYSNTGYKTKKFSYTNDMPWWWYRDKKPDCQEVIDLDKEEENDFIKNIYEDWEIEVVNEMIKRDIPEYDWEKYLILVQMGFEFENITNEDLKLVDIWEV